MKRLLTSVASRLKPSSWRLDDLAEVERALDVRLPTTFTSMLLRYDLGKFRINNLCFDLRGDYLKFLRAENDNEKGGVWWGNGRPPDRLILIASSDAHEILLNTTDGHIYAFLRSRSPTDRELIAIDLEHFVRALGTIAVLPEDVPELQSLTLEIARAAGASGSAFWTEFAQGVT